VTQVLKAHPSDGGKEQAKAIVRPSVEANRSVRNAKQEDDTPYQQNADEGEKPHHRVAAKVSQGKSLNENDSHESGPGESLKQLALPINVGKDVLSYDDRHKGDPGQVSKVKGRKAEIEQDS
jgi:hypothetical protein